MVHMFLCDKDLLESLRGDAPPSEEIRSEIRKQKPAKCSECKGQVIHGNGWRSRSVVQAWNDWNCIWYWRLECQVCKKSHCLMPAIVFPDLLYDSDVVIEVIVGRLAGKPARDFAPHQRTQKRWLDRIRDAWPIAQCIEAIRGTLDDCCNTASKLQEAILRCATHHIGLFFPSQTERNKTDASTRRKHPAIATHQSCPSTCRDFL